MSNLFNTVLVRKPRRNVFDLSHDKKLSMDMGRLYPVLCQEILPGDKFSISSTQMIRFAPLIAPTMHRVKVFTHYFFVPTRILWKNWEPFITGGEDGKANHAFPYIRFNKDNRAEIGSLADYMGIPEINGSTVDANNIDVSAIPFAAYAKIFDEYYRDQNLQDPIGIELHDGINTGEISKLFGYESVGLDTGGIPLKRAWRHDYFTSALPFPQKGDDVLLPLGDTAELVFDKENGQPSEYYKTQNSESTFPSWNSGDLDVATSYLTGPGGEGDEAPPGYLYSQDELNTRQFDPTKVDVTKHTHVDLSSATSSTINDLRRAFRLQEWLEKNARAGSRYVESILAHFGVKSSDARLQRPEYLGGTASPVVISEVLQTSSPQGSGDTPQANMSGHGLSVSSGFVGNKFFEEHGYIIGIMSVMPEPAYQQGVPRHFSKFDKFDYFYPEFAHIGEQEIKNKELFVGDDDQNEETFGYIPRYSEYRFNPSTVHGDFKDTLDFWHIGRKFANRPQLNEDFIGCNPGKHIFAVQDVPDSGDGTTGIRNWNTLYCHVFHKIKAVRPLPKYGTPTF